MVRHLVTGGAGFIGSNLAEALVKSGHPVRVLDNFATGARANLAAGAVELLEGDLRDPATTHAVNATGTLTLLLAARRAGVRRVVYASSSSSSIYGESPTLPKREEMPSQPKSPSASDSQPWSGSTSRCTSAWWKRSALSGARACQWGAV